MIRRPPRSTPLYSSAASDVYKRQIYRMKSILKNDGKTYVSEGIDANFQDILNYSVFAQILLKE